MLSIIKFELSKILKSKKTIILFGITVFIITVLSFAYFSEDIEDVYNIPMNHILYYQNMIDSEKYFEKDENLSEELDMLLNQKEYDKTFLVNFNSIYHKYFGRIYSNDEKLHNNDNYKIGLYQLKFNERLVKKNIEPIFRDEFVGYNFLIVAMKKFIPLLVIVIPMLLSFDIITKENESGSFKFLLLQPTKRSKILVAKVLACSIVSICLILLPTLLIFGSVSLINGMGDGDYPMLYDNNSYKTINPVFKTPGLLITEKSVSQTDYSQDSTYLVGLSEYFNDYRSIGDRVPNNKLEFVSIRKLILTSIPLLIFFIIFITILSMFISTVMQNSILSIILGIIISVLGYLSVNIVIKSPMLSKICPFYYTQSLKILSGMGVQTVLTGMIVLSIYIIFLLVASMFIFRKRDIKC